MRLRPSVRSLVLTTAAALVLLVGCFGVAWARVSDAALRDTDIYERYGALTAGGAVPYRDFRVEYPPGALPAFVLPSELAGANDHAVWEPTLNEPARRYARMFAALMIGLVAMTIVLTAASLRALGAPETQIATALGLLAISPLLLGNLVFFRFDVWPAVLTAAALSALLHSRFGAAGVVLGIGIATKLYPAVLVPLAIAHVWKQRGRRAALGLVGVTATTTVAVFLPFLTIAPGATFWPVRQQLSRGLQAESLGASVLAALHVTTLRLHDQGVPVATAPLHLVENAGGLNGAEVQGVAGAIVGDISGVLTIAILAWAWTAFARGPCSPDRLVRFAAVALTASLAVGRVLSPQFVIWLLPVVPLVSGRRGQVASAALAATLLLTHLWIPGPYIDYLNSVSSGALRPVGLLLLRNVMLLGVLVVLVSPPASRRWIFRERLARAST